MSRAFFFASTISSRDCIGNGWTRNTVIIREQRKGHLAQAFPGIHTLHDPIWRYNIQILLRLSRREIGLDCSQILVLREGHVLRNKMR